MVPLSKYQNGRERRPAGHAPLNEAAGVPSLLHGDLRDTAKRFAILFE
jgi:hypothetical protein